MLLKSATSGNRPRVERSTRCRTVAKRKQLTSVVTPAPLIDPLQSAISRLCETNCALKSDQWAQLTRTMLKAGLNNKSPNQRAAWAALIEMRKVDVTSAKAVLDAMVASQQPGVVEPTQTVPDVEVAAGLSGYLEHHADSGTILPIQPAAPATVETGPTGRRRRSILGGAVDAAGETGPVAEAGAG